MHVFLNVIIFATLGTVLAIADISIEKWQYWAIMACCIAASINGILW